MQITAKIPIEIIDVIQGLILLFLAAEVVVRRLFRDPRRTGRRRRARDGHRASYGGRRRV